MAGLIRSFIAVKVPDDICDELETFLSELKPLARIRWVKREQFHVTLKFLGEITPQKVEHVKTLLSPMKRFAPFKIELSHAGAFPNFRAPRVLWLSGKSGTEELTALAEKINDSLYDKAGLPRDDKKFRAHLTLARLKGESLTPELVQKLETVKKFTWLCDELVLMKSELRPSGPVYSQLL